MADASTRESTGAFPLVCAFCVALVPFVLQRTYILNDFYHFGAVYFDSGLFANLLWRNDWLLTTPHVYGGGDQSYLTVHVSPFLMLINGLSYVAPTHPVEFYAAFMGVIDASLAAAMCYTLVVCVQPKSMWHVIALGMIAIGFAFNGVIMRGVWLPHFEYAIPAGILLFLVNLKRGSTRWAVFFFVLTLSLREDAGFHLATVLVVLIAAQWLKTRSLSGVERDVEFTVVACTYSVIAWSVGYGARALRGINVSVFQLIYTGEPPYAHLSMQLLGTRMVQMVVDAPYLFTGVLVSLVWAIYRRNVYWIMGFAACVPWFLVNWTAVNPNTGVLFAYYGFPFVLGMGWPCIAILCQYGRRPPRTAVRDALALQVALVVAGLGAWNTDEGRLDFGPKWWARRGSYVASWKTMQDGASVDLRPIMRDLAMEISANRRLGIVMVDSGMMSLTVGSKSQRRGVTLWPFDATHLADTIVYFCPFDRPTPEGALNKAKQSGLAMHYRAIDVPVCVFSNRSLEQLGPLAKLLAS